MIIGLLVGVASALVLLWMWRMAESLRRDAAEDEQSDNEHMQRP